MKSTGNTGKTLSEVGEKYVHLSEQQDVLIYKEILAQVGKTPLVKQPLWW